MRAGMVENSTKFFQGEWMHCALCTRQEKSDPAKESQWRVAELDGYPYYVCPSHLPEDGAGAAAFAAAYEMLLRRLINLHNDRNRRVM